MPYTLVPTPPHTPEVRAIHPFGKIPVARHGALTLCESRAICLYIERAFAAPALVPADPAAAALVEQWISLINTHIDPLLLRRYLRAYFFPDTADGSPDRKTIEGALPDMRTQFAVLDAAVSATGYLAGSSFAIGMSEGPQRGLMLMDSLGVSGALNEYYLPHAARADMLRRSNRREAAAEAYRHALALATNETERRFLLRRLQELGSESG